MTAHNPQRMSDAQYTRLCSMAKPLSWIRNNTPEFIAFFDAERAIIDRVEALPVHEFHCYYPELANRQFVELKDIQAAIHPQEPKE